MWVITNTGLISIVANRNKGFQGTFIVRARRRQDLRAFFGDPNIDEFIQHTADADYHYRVYTGEESLKAAMLHQVELIDYGNFKDSIPEADQDLKRFATETWLSGYRNLSEGTEQDVPVLTSVNTRRKDERRR
jgi:hypothetical protein